MKTQIDISRMDKAAVLCALYNGGRIQGLGALHYVKGGLPIDEARDLLTKETYFDYLKGRVLKVDLSGNVLDTRLFDRDNGLGAAEFALQLAGLLPIATAKEE